MHSPRKQSESRHKPLNFDDTETAFRGKSDAYLERAYWLFRIISVRPLIRIGRPLISAAMKLGLLPEVLIRKTIFRHFCGGETISECEQTISQLNQGKVGSILDYSVEGEDEEGTFEETCQEIIRTIQRADGDMRIPFAVFKVTGLGRFALLERRDAGKPLSEDEKVEFNKIKSRVDQICGMAHQLNVRVMIDAEESWIQESIDEMALEMMRRYNQDTAIVYNTYQLYRKDKLELLRADIKMGNSEGFIVGAKLVRGAYLEKERKRALKNDYPSPIQDSREETDAAYNEALRFCINHIRHVAFVAGTHNEESCRLLARLLDENRIPHNHKNVYFSQLLGMSDNLSFNLAAVGYNVAKYVPYGPVKAVMPYLIRRAEENSSVTGQMSRELKLILSEKQRRKQATPE